MNLRLDFVNGVLVDECLLHWEERDQDFALALSMVSKDSASDMVVL